MTVPNAIWYGIAPSRSAKTAMEFVDGFEGILVCDAYIAYETLAKASDKKIVLALCWSHARRKFVDAEPHYPQCAEAVDLIGTLFAIDRDTDDPNLMAGDAKLTQNSWSVGRHRDTNMRGAGLQSLAREARDLDSSVDENDADLCLRVARP